MFFKCNIICDSVYYRQTIISDWCFIKKLLLKLLKLLLWKCNLKKSIIWISESLKDTVRKGEVILKENKDGKATCWTKFPLSETADGCAIFGWAVCIQCHCCVMFKSISTEGMVKSYGTTNMTDHLQSCFASRGKQLTMNAFVKRTLGVNFTAAE